MKKVGWWKSQRLLHKMKKPVKLLSQTLDFPIFNLPGRKIIFPYMKCWKPKMFTNLLWGTSCILMDTWRTFPIILLNPILVVTVTSSAWSKLLDHSLHLALELLVRITTIMVSGVCDSRYWTLVGLNFIPLLYVDALEVFLLVYWVSFCEP